MTTTTITAVVDKVAAVIAALVPLAAPVTTGFVRHAGSHLRLRDWAPQAGGNLMFRRFEVDNGNWSGPGINDHGVKLIGVPVEVVILYPAVPKLYGLTNLFDLDALIRSDADQIYDALMKPSAKVAGQQAFIDLEVGRIERSGQFWFQPVTATAALYAAKH